MANERRAGKHFLISGVIGVLIAIVLYILGAFAFSRPFVSHVALILAPAMILGLAEPSSPGPMVLLLVIVFAINFVL